MDFSQMSDEQLQKLAGYNRAPSTIASPLPDMSQYSDEELQKLATGNREPSTIPQVQQGDVPGYGESFLRGAGQGVSLGYGPRIMGALHGSALMNPSGSEFPTFDFNNVPEDKSKEALDVYNKTVKEQTAANERAQKEHPLTYFGGNVAGGVALTPLMGASPLAAMTQGAISGSSEGENISDRAENAVIGGGAGYALGHVFNNLFGAANPATTKTVQAAKDMGIDIPRFVASPEITMQSAANILRNFPIAGEPIEKASRQTIAQMGKAVDNLGGVNPEQAGQIFGDGIKKWVSETSNNILNKAYTAAGSKMDPAIRTPLNDTLTTVSDIMARRVNASIPGQSGAANYVIDAIQKPGGLNYNGIKDLRTYVGQQMNGGILPENVSGAELKQIYSALTNDLNAAAKNAGGPEGLKMHQNANTLAKAVNDKREALISLIGGNAANASSENVFGNIAALAGNKTGSADVNLLNQVRRVMSPDEWKRATSGVISHMGRDADGNFSPARFLGPNGFNSLSDAGKDLLFGASDTPMRNSLETIADVSRQFGNLQKYANTSGTGHAVIGAETAKQALANPLDVLASMVGGRKVAEMISNPTTSGATGEWVKAYLNSMPHTPIGSSLNLVAEGTARSAYQALKAATQNLTSINAPDTAKVIAQLTQGLWQPPVEALKKTINERQGHAAGGAVLDHEAEADKLVRAAEREKNNVNKTTEGLLNVDDNTIAHALDVAQAAI